MSALVDEVRQRRSFTPAMARAIRERAGVSQARVARELGVHPVTVTRWETGVRRPSSALMPLYTALLDQLSEATL